MVNQIKISDIEAAYLLGRLEGFVSVRQLFAAVSPNDAQSQIGKNIDEITKKLEIMGFERLKSEIKGYLY